MEKDSGVTRFPDLGKVSIAILEHLVQKIIGKKPINELRKPLDQKIITEKIAYALKHAEKRFVGDCESREITDTLLNLPLVDLPSVLQAAHIYHEKPADNLLHSALCEQLQADLPKLSRSQIESAVSLYMEILEEELLLASDVFRQKMNAMAAMRTSRETSKSLGVLEQIVQAIDGLQKTLGRVESDHYIKIFSIDDYVQVLYDATSVLNFPGIPSAPDGIHPKFDEIYVTQRLENKSRSREGSYESFLKTQRLLVEDIAGSGKTMLVKRFLLDLCRANLRKVKCSPIPLCLHVSQIAAQQDKPFGQQIIDAVSKERGLSGELSRLLKGAIDKKIVSLLIDGFDEVPHDSRLKVSTTLVNSDFFRDGNQVIIASRPVGNVGFTAFTNANILRFDLYSAYLLVDKWMQYLKEQGVLSDSGATRLMALKEYLNKCYEKKTLSKSILETPLYLTYFIFDLAAPSAAQHDPYYLLDSKPLLIKNILEHIIPYWEGYKNGLVLGQGALPSKSIAMKALWCVGFYLLQKPGGSRDDILEALDYERKDFLRDLSLREIEQSLSYWQGCNVLCVDRHNVLSYWHNEFMEYCAARYLVKRYDGSETGMDKQVKEALLSDKDWENARRLYQIMSSRAGGNG